MRITEMQPGPHVPYSLAGFILSVGDIAINLATEQDDTQKIIDVCADANGTLVKGMSEAYVANILIPPAQYTDAPTGENDEDGNPIFAPEKQQLDTERVELLLWRYEPQTKNIEEE